jgi:two-component system, OmpR family, alkaline phosphatase synthesis response regulator PhoP
VSKRVLIGDDERHILRLAEVNLQRAGYQVFAALDPETAFEIARRELPDLIIIDGDWRDLAQRLRSDPATSRIELRVLGEGKPF